MIRVPWGTVIVGGMLMYFPMAASVAPPRASVTPETAWVLPPPVEIVTPLLTGIVSAPVEDVDDDTVDVELDLAELERGLCLHRQGCGGEKRQGKGCQRSRTKDVVHVQPRMEVRAVSR